MNKVMKKFKVGSLSATTLMKDDDGQLFVRKIVSLVEDREYVFKDGTMVKLTKPSKLHSLGWKHNVELTYGIKTMYEWYLREVV